MMIRLLLAMCLLSTPLAAQELPALYNVHDVASDDVLNIRAKPSGDAPIIGALTYNAKDIEVVRSQNGWALVNTGERAGWVFMRYLATAANQPSHAYPARCFGTEPFWSLDNGDEMVLTLMGDAPFPFTPVDGGTATGRPDRFFALGVDGTSSLTAIISRQSCNDGMSDREFGLGVDVLLNTATGRALYSGCCALR